MIRKIAISGMKGRKKDTFLLSFVVLLSFLFIVIATVFYSSSEKTKNIQRTNMFGTWDASYLNGDEKIGKDLLNVDEVNTIASSRILGKSSTLGFVGTFNQQLSNLGHFQMYEGRLPESDNEIALELSQLSYFSKDVKVGDIIPVEVVIPLMELDTYEVYNKQLQRLEFDIYKNKYNNTWRYNYIQRERRKLNLDTYDSTPINILYIFNMNRIGRNEPTLEVFNGTKVVIKTSYSYFSFGETDEVIDDNIEKVKKDGTMFSQSAVITKDMVVSGIIQTYSNVWDLDSYPVANSFVTEDAGKLFLENGFLKTQEIDVSDYNVPVNYFIKSEISANDFYNKYNNDFDKLRKNNFAYPETEGSTETTLTYGILAFIFIATIFSVFQIYLTQMKRRTRKIALLKSIGATNKQVGGILIWEVVYLLAFCIPISLIGGVFTVKLILIIMNNLGKGDLNFYLDYTLTGLGLVVGVISVIIGMTIPMIKSMNVPLTGNISKAPKHKRKFAKEKLKVKFQGIDIKVQTFSKISLRNARFNRGNMILSLGLYTITLFVLLSSIFLSFVAFEDYINQIIVTDKADYGFEFDFGMRNREIPVFLEELKSIEGVKKAELYTAGEHAFLWYEGIKENIVQTTFKEMLPINLIDQHFGENSLKYKNLNEDNTHLIKDSVVVNTYGVDINDKVFARFKDSVTEGVIDLEKFNKGSEVIVLMPQYFSPENNKGETTIADKSILENTEQKSRIKQLFQYSKTHDINYDFRNKDYYLKDDSLSVGDKIKLTIPTEQLDGDALTNEVAFHELTVGAIINYFPEIGIWPFSGTVENPVIIGSYNLITDLYPSSLGGKGNLTAEYIRSLISSFAPTKYGKTWVNVFVDKNSDDVQVLVELQRLALERESRLTNHMQSNNKIFNKGFRIASIIIILGVSVALIALVILYNTTLSKLEQERERIGILQAIGVTGSQFKKLYLTTGVLYGTISMVLAHILLSIIVVVTTISSNGPFIMNIKNGLWLYPWNIHILVCLIFFVITVLTYYLPLGKILKNQPVVNIRSLNS